MTSQIIFPLVANFLNVQNMLLSQLGLHESRTTCCKDFFPGKGEALDGLVETLFPVELYPLKFPFFLGTTYLHQESGLELFDLFVVLASLTFEVLLPDDIYHTEVLPNTLNRLSGFIFLIVNNQTGFSSRDRHIQILQLDAEQRELSINHGAILSRSINHLILFLILPGLFNLFGIGWLLFICL